MRALALDPETGDFAITAGRTRLTAPGAETVAQRLRGRLGLHQGEWFLDRRVGVPWIARVLVKAPDLGFIESLIRRVITTCPGVASLPSFGLDVDNATRVASVAYEATAEDGEPVTGDFVFGGEGTP